MKIIILLCFFSGLAQSSDHNGNDNCWKQCDPKDYIAVVTCNGKEGNEDPCTCVKRLDGLDCGTEIGILKGPLTWTGCHKLALDRGDQFETPHEFFRWEDMEIEVEGATEIHQLCYILPAPCTGLPPGECRPYDGAPCVAGVSTEECEPVASVFCDNPEWNDEGIHWICAGPNGVVNAYTPGETIPKGTTCTTDKIECETWDWVEGTHDSEKKIATVQCGDNIWESNPTDKLLIDNSPVDENGLPIDAYHILPNLNDAVCRCPLLEISEATYATPGLSLLCDQGYNPLDGGIKYGNACTLLCDGHFKMYIECIKGQWKNTGADYPFADVTKEDINC